MFFLKSHVGRETYIQSHCEITLGEGGSYYSFNCSLFDIKVTFSLNEEFL